MLPSALLASALLASSAFAAAAAPPPPPSSSFRRRLQTALNLSGSDDLSPLASDAASHLAELCEDTNGDPNPRVTCTEGNARAAEYVAGVLGDLGLEPGGSSSSSDGGGGGGGNGTLTRSYFQTVGGSVHEELCPRGIRNVAGYVPGTSRPDEFVVYSAHFDGPNNDNPQTDRTRGNGETSNAYDNGLAVAVGLALAKSLMANPPETSVFFLFDDGEEGWDNVLVPDEGESNACDKFVGTEWLRNIYVDLGGNVAETQTTSGCPYWQSIGSSYWAKYPTVDPATVRVMYVIDPLGSPYGASNQVLAAIGGERVSYGESGATLNDFLDEVYPAESAVKLAKTPRVTVEDFASSVDPMVGDRYLELCGNGCLESGGLPAVWLAQPSFQKYHGGYAVYVAKDLFGAVSSSEGEFPNPVYFSVDNLAAFYLPNLDDMAQALLGLVTNSAEVGATDGLSHDGGRGDDLDTSDVVNTLAALDVFVLLTQDLPEPTGSLFRLYVDAARPQLEALLGADLADPVNQASARQLSSLVVAMAVAMDFFNEEYPTREAFEDQTYGPPPNYVEDEEEAPALVEDVGADVDADADPPTAEPTGEKEDVASDVAATLAPTVGPAATDAVPTPSTSPTEDRTSADDPTTTLSSSASSFGTTVAMSSRYLAVAATFLVGVALLA